jgi:hypothetical protein
MNSQPLFRLSLFALAGFIAACAVHKKTWRLEKILDPGLAHHVGLSP